MSSIRLNNTVDRDKFNRQIRYLVKCGTTYLDAIVETQELFKLTEHETPAILDRDIQLCLQRESLERHLIDEPVFNEQSDIQP